MMDFNNLGLQNCYKFDNDYEDSCGIITGVPSGGISFAAPKLGTASVSFDGTAGNKISLSNIVCRSFKTGISLSCWFNASSLSGSQRFPFLISKSTDEETGNIFLLGITRTAPQRLRFGITTKSSGYTELLGTTTINTGTWYFALATYDTTTTTMNLYLGGSGLENTLTISGPPGLDVRLLGSVVTGLSHSAPSGTNRVLIFAAGNEYSSATTATSVTYGGQPMTLINQITVSGFYVNYISLWRLNEAGIAAAVGSNFVVNWSGSRFENIYHSAFYENVDQTTPIGYNDSASITSSVSISTASTTPNDGNMIIMSVVSGSTSGWDSTSLITLGAETVGSDYAQAWAYELGGNVTITPTFNGNGSQVRQAAISIELLKVGGGNGTETIMEDNTVETVIGGISSGATTPNGVPTFNGRIDQAIIWNKALSSTEFTKIYNGGAGEQYPELLFDFGRRPENKQQMLDSRESATDLGIDGANPVSMSFWCYRREEGTGGIFYVGDWADGFGFGFKPGILVFYFGGSLLEYAYVTPLEEWMHIVLGYDGTNLLFYINGEEVLFGPISKNVIDGKTFTIGAIRGEKEVEYFTGSISDFRIYNRGLSEAEVQTICNTQGRDAIREGLIRQWLTTRQIIKSTEIMGGGAPITLTSNNSTTSSWNHPVAAGTNRILLVAVSNETVSPLPTEPVVAESVSYGGVKLTSIRSFTDNNTNRFQQGEFWLLTDADIDRAISDTISVTWNSPGDINFQCNFSIFFENVAQHGAAKYSLVNSFNGVGTRLDLKGAYGDANDVIIALYTAAQADVSPSLVAYNGYTKIIEQVAGVLEGDSMSSGVFSKTIMGPGGSADYPDIETNVTVSPSVDRQLIVAIALSSPQDDIPSTAEEIHVLKTGSKVRYTEDIIRIR